MDGDKEWNDAFFEEMAMNGIFEFMWEDMLNDSPLSQEDIDFSFEIDMSDVEDQLCL